MIYFDFSKAGVSLERLEKYFETYCNVVLYLFIKDYASYYYDDFEDDFDDLFEDDEEDESDFVEE